MGFFSFIFFSSATNRVSPLAVLSQSSPRLRVHSATLILRAHFRHEAIPSSARKQVVCRLFEHGEQYDQSARQRQEASNPWWSARVSLHPSTLPPHILLRLCRKHYLQLLFILIFPTIIFYLILPAIYSSPPYSSSSLFSWRLFYCATS